MDPVILGAKAPSSGKIWCLKRLCAIQEDLSESFPTLSTRSRCIKNSKQSSSVRYLLKKLFLRNITHNNTHFKLVIDCNRPEKCFDLSEKRVLSIISRLLKLHSKPQTPTVLKYEDMYSIQSSLTQNNAHLYQHCNKQRLCRARSARDLKVSTRPLTQTVLPPHQCWLLPNLHPIKTLSAKKNICMKNDRTTKMKLPDNAKHGERGSPMGWVVPASHAMLIGPQFSLNQNATPKRKSWTYKGVEQRVAFSAST